MDNTLRLVIGQAAGILFFISFIPYLISIFKGETKPARMTYFIKSVISIVTIALYIELGARTSIWVGLVSALTAFTVFGLSIKHGMGGFSKLDVFSLFLAAIGIIIWVTTKDAALALYIGIFVKFIATLPLIKKSYLHPNTENHLSWILALIADALNLFALTSLKPNISALPIFEAVDSAVVVILLLGVFTKKYQGRMAK